MNFCQIQHSSRSRQYHKNGHHYNHHCLIHALVLLLLASIVQAAPTITGVTVVGGSSTISSSTEVRISGSDLGVTGDTVVVTYDKAAGFASKYTTGTCTLSATDIGHIICPTVAGVGADLVFRVQVNGVTSGSSSNTVTYARPAITNLAGSLSNTAGGTEITLTGTSFGPASHSEASATYGPSSSPNLYSVTSCTVDSDTQMRCDTVAGKGVDLQWTVTVGGQTPSSAYTAKKTSYLPPTITSIVKTGGAGTLATAGTDTVDVGGTNFGPTCSGCITATYGGSAGTDYGSVTCDVTSANTAMVCNTVGGVGADHGWVVTVESQASAKSTATISYTAPAITSVVKTGGAGTLATAGTDTVDIGGTNFGPLCTGCVTVTYGGNAGGTNYPTSGTITCNVVTADTALLCNTVEGVGASHGWVMTIGSQTSGAKSSAVTSYARPAITNLAGSLSNTAGGTEITLTGTSFGPASHSEASATYGPSSSPNLYSVTSCTVDSDTQMRCDTVAGKGVDLQWTVTVGGQTPSSAYTAKKTSYLPPTITSIVKTGGAGTLATAGTDTVDVGGTNFGPTCSGCITATYGGSAGTDYGSVTCDVTSANTAMVCNTVGGVGADHGWVVTVESQASAKSTATISYTAPAITSVVKTGGAGTLATAGTDTVDIGGTNFGPLCTGCVTVTYGGNAGGTNYPTSGTITCNVVTADTALLCNTVEGVGASHGWVMTIGSQTSGAKSSAVTSYARPAITNLAGSLSNTAGGTEITLTGTSFGPASHSEASATYGPSSSPNLYSVTSCTVDSDTQMRCDTVAGKGVDLQWTVTVGGQTPSSAYTAKKTSYLPPTITSIVKTGGAGTLATAGTDTVDVGGTNFGPTCSGCITATYGGSAGTDYGSVTCDVTSANTAMVCNTVGGVGADHGWVVTVESQASVKSTATISYTAPAITSVVKTGGAGTLATAGTDTVDIGGTNFGPLCTGCVTVTYGGNAGGTNYPTSGTITCNVVTADTALLCNTVEGVGASHGWVMTIGSQTSGAKSSAVTSYARPAITNLAGSLSNTAGGTEITLTGTSFGPASHSEASATYGPSSSPNLYSVTSCTVDSDTQMRCDTVAGKGVDLQWTVTVGGQTPSSAYTAKKTSYLPPTITSIVKTGGAGTLATAGTDTVDVGGTNFGPTCSGCITATYGGSAGTDYGSVTCDVTSANTAMVCNTVGGVGADHGWVVTVESQASVKSTVTISYTAPAITSVVKTGGAGTLATAGTDTVDIGGTNFGPTCTGCITATYGVNAGGTNYPAVGTLSCDVTSANTAMVCNTVGGVGINHGWVVTVESQASAKSTATISYTAPAITSVVKTGGAGTLATAGTDTVDIGGTNFGPLCTGCVTVTYGGNAGGTNYPTSGTITCNVVTADTALLCNTVEGVGASHGWVMTIGSQTSGAKSSAVTSYARPAITNLAGSLSNTAGGTEITLTGTSFGPASHSEASATYGPSSSPNLYSVTSCTVDSDTQMRCDTVAGKGVDLQWTVTVGGQTPSSAYTAKKTSYLPPTITSIVKQVVRVLLQPLGRIRLMLVVPTLALLVLGV